MGRHQFSNFSYESCFFFFFTFFFIRVRLPRGGSYVYEKRKRVMERFILLPRVGYFSAQQILYGKALFVIIQLWHSESVGEKNDEAVK